MYLRLINFVNRYRDQIRLYIETYIYMYINHIKKKMSKGILNYLDILIALNHLQ